MNIADTLGILGRLIIAVVLGGLVGWQRETVDRPAGFRTHVLVCVGSATYMMVSRLMQGEGSDPARIAAQVASGMGFLGAGTIFRAGNVVRGLTTAASLWTVAAIGLCVGASSQESLVIAVLVTVVVLVTLSVLGRVERWLPGTRRITLAVGVRDLEGALPLIRATLRGIQVRLMSVRRMEESEDERRHMVEMIVRAPVSLDPTMIIDALLPLENVDSAETR